MTSLLEFRSNKYSQNGEDGVIAELLVRLDISKGWFVDVGACDGRHLSNTFCLVDCGWSGVEIEPDPAKFEDLVRTAAGFPGQLLPICDRAAGDGPSSLERLLGDTSVPREFDVLNIDIDSYDYQVWSGLKCYQPKVVVIESNSAYLPAVEVVHRAGSTEPGSSFSARRALGSSKGYSLVCHTGKMVVWEA